MTRPLRVEYPGAYYHVINREIAKGRKKNEAHGHNVALHAGLSGLSLLKKGKKG